MLVRTEQNDSANGWIFLEPLEMDLWGGFLAFFIFIGFVIWAIEQRINPEFQGSRKEQLGTTFYFVFSTLVNAHSKVPWSIFYEITRLYLIPSFLHFPGQELRSNLSRFVVIIWVFVVLIVISSYTASLASMLTVQRLQPATVEDLLRNGDFIGYQRGSYVENHLQGMDFHPSKMRGYDSPEEYETALLKGSRNGGVTAIFDEMPYLRIFLASRCREYNVFGPVLNTKGFGFVSSESCVSEIYSLLLNSSLLFCLIPSGISQRLPSRGGCIKSYSKCYRDGVAGSAGEEIFRR